MTHFELAWHVGNLVTQYGLWSLAIPDSRRIRLTGWPDLVILGSRLIFRELKTEHGTLSSMQKWLGWKLRAAGQDWQVWRPHDFIDGRIETELASLV